MIKPLRAIARFVLRHTGGTDIPVCLLGTLCFALAGARAEATFIDFEDLSLASESFNNGSDGAGGFTSGGAAFNNTFTDFGGGFTAWSGWSYSNITDVTTPGFGNQYSAYNTPSGGGDGSSNYGVAFNSAPGDATVELPSGFAPLSARITNTTYGALSMRDGDAFAKKFGGASGNDPDFFLLNIRGFDAANALTGEVPFYLADYRFADNALDYIVDQWTAVDLTPLGAASRLEFEFDSSDTGMFGINTPTYFAIDNIASVPEPGTITLVIVAAGIFGAGGVRRAIARRACKQRASQHHEA